MRIACGKILKINLVVVVFLAIVLSGGSNSLFAASCKNGPCCKQGDIQGPIVEPKHNKNKEGEGDLNLGGFTVLSSILAVGQGLRSSTNKITGTFNKRFEGQSSFLRKLLVSLGVSRKKSASNKMFGVNSKTYNSGSKFSGSRVRSGLNARDSISSKLRKDFHEYHREFGSKKQIRDRLKDAPSYGGMFASKGDMTSKELARGKEWAKTVLDPFPSISPDKEVKSAMSSDYNSLRKVKETKSLIPEAVMGDLIAARAPTIELGGWAEKMQRRMGEKGKLERSINGKISVNVLSALLTNMRFANQDWLSNKKGIHGMTRTGVLRELLQTRIDKLRTAYREMLWLDKMAALASQGVFSKNREYNNLLNQIEKKVLQK